MADPPFHITYIIIAITSLVSIAGWRDQAFFNRLKSNPYMIIHRREWWRLFGHGALHSNEFHLIVNMVVLYMFGIPLELDLYFLFGPVMGKVWFVVMYVMALAFASLPSLLKHKNNHHYNAIGASGAVAAILFCEILLHPTNNLRFIFVPFNIPAFIMGFIYLLSETIMNKKGNTGIGHDAHLAGAIFGVVFLIILDGEVLIRFTEELGAWTRGLF